MFSFLHSTQEIVKMTTYSTGLFIVFHLAFVLLSEYRLWDAQSQKAYYINVSINASKITRYRHITHTKSSSSYDMLVKLI